MRDLSDAEFLAAMPATPRAATPSWTPGGPDASAWSDTPPNRTGPAGRRPTEAAHHRPGKYRTGARPSPSAIPPDQARLADHLSDFGNGHVLEEKIKPILGRPTRWRFERWRVGRSIPASGPSLNDHGGAGAEPELPVWKTCGYRLLPRFQS
ncbi:hypothetical protein GCM10022233_47060 [Streptomyces shaanxiensis]|uniref:Uncharacterized protein n=1 Tax=Streptomyces shaanxiensis TaxID=653357 RepID=A0ABP7VIE6_9ACTN